jgi:hypothetical protein
MKVMFDSNVWRIIVSPRRFPRESSLTGFSTLRNAIGNHRIEAFLSETVFTIEAIKRVNRKQFISTRKVKDPVSGATEVTIGLANNPILMSHFSDAKAMGFRIVRFPRIAGFENTDVDPYLFRLPSSDLESYQKKAFEVGSRIEKAGSGIAHIRQIGQKFHRAWLNGLRMAPESEDGNISKAAAEWADGDSVAVCIALGCDYFCTRDVAKSAGKDSILGAKNLLWLDSDYGFRIISPEALALKV